jgi:SAM-dependent methyltransferase
MRTRGARAAMDLPAGASPEALAAQLRAGVVPPDCAFDQYLPDHVRAVSDRHWTPLHVVSRGVRWLLAAGVRSVVDVGAGAGKFCVAAALCGDLTCIGLEQRQRLVCTARDLARRFQVDDRVRFDECRFGSCDVPAADAYYFYNPFAETIMGRDDRIDAHAERGLERYLTDLRTARVFLRSLPAGALVLTYHGFGGRMPGAFDEVRADSRIPALLRLYRKTARRP